MSDSNIENTINFDNQPSLNIFAHAYSFGNNPDLNSIDIDEHMPTYVNYKYYSVDAFCQFGNSVAYSLDVFSTIHCNIRSLSLGSMLVKLNFPFSVIALTETKIKLDQDILVQHKA
jgi:hypothetical protein